MKKVSCKILVLVIALAAIFTSEAEASNFRHSRRDRSAFGVSTNSVSSFYRTVVGTIRNIPVQLSFGSKSKNANYAVYSTSPAKRNASQFANLD